MIKWPSGKVVKCFDLFPGHDEQMRSWCSQNGQSLKQIHRQTMAAKDNINVEPKKDDRYEGLSPWNSLDDFEKKWPTFGIYESLLVWNLRYCSRKKKGLTTLHTTVHTTHNLQVETGYNENIWTWTFQSTPIRLETWVSDIPNWRLAGEQFVVRWFAPLFQVLIINLDSTEKGSDVDLKWFLKRESKQTGLPRRVPGRNWLFLACRYTQRGAGNVWDVYNRAVAWSKSLLFSKSKLWREINSHQ
jgi:hypothetical protein